MELAKKNSAVHSLFPYPVYKNRITHPGKYYETIWATLIPVDMISRPTCLIPTVPSIRTDPSQVDRYSRTLLYWSFPYSYMDRSNWNSMTAEQYEILSHPAPLNFVTTDFDEGGSGDDESFGSSIAGAAVSYDDYSNCDIDENNERALLSDGADSIES